jgi:hypothetical protein
MTLTSNQRKIFDQFRKKHTELISQERYEEATKLSLYFIEHSGIDKDSLRTAIKVSKMPLDYDEKF